MRGNPLLVKAWRTLARNTSDAGALEEPFPYRAWKWFWQRTPTVGRSPDLFDRLDATSWDVLVLLDACRYDTLAALAPDAVVGRARSPGSATPEFLAAAAASGVFEGAVYVSGNPQSGEHDPGDVAEHVPVYERAWNDDLSTVTPEPVFDAVREYAARGDRVVAHTMQPHYPHVCEIDGRTVAVPGGLHPDYFEDDRLRDAGLQAILASGRVDLDRARRSYEASVRYAWRKASAFAVELAAEGHSVVVTADHGELFGERGFVEHPVGVTVPDVVDVPWVRFAPSADAEAPSDVTDRLAALGYAES